MTWQSEGFATAVGTDDSGRYLGLTSGSHPGSLQPTALIVNPAFALGQLEAEAGSAFTTEPPVAPEDELEGPPPPTRYSGLVRLDAGRPTRDFGRIAQEVIEHLSSLTETEVEITVEIHAEREEGIPDGVSRTVLENARTLKFDRNDLD